MIVVPLIVSGIIISLEQLELYAVIALPTFVKHEAAVRCDSSGYAGIQLHHHDSVHQLASSTILYVSPTPTTW